jgi:hypothetical protein
VTGTGVVGGSGMGSVAGHLASNSSRLSAPDRNAPNSSANWFRPTRSSAPRGTCDPTSGACDDAESPDTTGSSQIAGSPETAGSPAEAGGSVTAGTSAAAVAGAHTLSVLTDSASSAAR